MVTDSFALFQLITEASARNHDFFNFSVRQCVVSCTKKSKRREKLKLV